MGALILPNTFVPGTPRPKGSMRHVGKGRMAEQVTGSGDWRAAVARAAWDALLEAERLGNPPGIFLGPVSVHIRLQFALPKSKHHPAYPTSRTTGDVDKHARNILDALVDAAVIRDDSQVVVLRAHKVYCHAQEIPGAHITVTEVVD